MIIYLCTITIQVKTATLSKQIIQIRFFSNYIHILCILIYFINQHDNYFTKMYIFFIIKYIVKHFRIMTNVNLVHIVSIVIEFKQ